MRLGFGLRLGHELPAPARSRVRVAVDGRGGRGGAGTGRAPSTDRRAGRPRPRRGPAGRRRPAEAMNRCHKRSILLNRGASRASREAVRPARSTAGDATIGPEGLGRRLERRRAAARAPSAPVRPVAAADRGPAERRIADQPAPAAQELPEHVRQDPAVLIVLDLLGRVDPDRRREPPRPSRRPRSPTTSTSRPAAKPEASPSARPSMSIRLLAGQAERLGRSRRPRTGAAGCPCRRGSSGGSARSSRRSRRGRPAAAAPWPPSRGRSPEPYSLPARMISGTPSARYFSEASKMRHRPRRRAGGGSSRPRCRGRACSGAGRWRTCPGP